MPKPLIGVLIGALLGCLDGLTAIFYPEAAPFLASIVIGSTVKGIVAGVVMGLIARRYRSLPLGAAAGLGVGAFLAFLAATQAVGHPYFAIMLPGSIVGLLVGLATQRFGRAPLAPAAAA